LFGIPAKVNNDLIPWVTFTDPELAHVGINEAEAIRRHGPASVKVLRWSMAENDRTQAERQTDGFVKIVVGPKGRILGATIVGAQAGEMINMWSLALSQKMKIGAMRGFISPYPTRAEVSKRAAITYYADFPKSGLAKFLLKLGRIFG
jgi:pyruvate/2-oxoglutarate dehydrogenase complex dihydrolipoamide dehydrogenase (E3) component